MDGQRKIEERAEEKEIQDRRDNVILHGVPERENGEREDSVNTFVNTVNLALHSPIRATDIAHSYRLGRPGQGKPRPLLARVVRSAVKFAILGCRSELKEKGFGVSGDLTPKQRQELQKARAQGLVAYYKGRVLHTEARAPPDTTAVETAEGTPASQTTNNSDYRGSRQRTRSNRGRGRGGRRR